MSKICTYCGTQIADGAGFCPNCGTAAPPDTPPVGSKFCPNCGASVTNGAAFCDKCGSRLNAAQPPQQQTYIQPPPPPVQQVQQPVYQQPVQPQTATQQQVQQVMQNYRQPAYQQPMMQSAGGTAVKQKKSKYPVIITVIAIFLAITLVVVLVFNPFGNAKSPLGEKLEASFSNLCDMTKLGSESYAFARLLTEQLLETDLASADPDGINDLFGQCLDAWKAVEDVSNKMISMSGELAADKGIQNAKVNTSRVSAVYADPDIVDLLFPFTVKASAADEDISTEVSAVASPAESVQQCSTLGMQILSDSQNGYTAVANLRAIYSGRTTPVQEWNSAVSTMAANFGMQFYVSGEITSGAFTTLPNGAHSVHTLSNAVKGGTVGVSNTDILIDVSENGGCMVFGTTCGLTINQDQFPDYTPSEGNRTISINTYPEEPNENGVTFHATSFFSWFRIDRVGGFTITRGNKGEGSVTDPPVVQNTGGNVDYTPPETNRGPISDFIPPTSPAVIRDTSENITNGNNNNNNNNSGNTGGNESLPPITSDDITHITNELGAGVGPITVTLGWQTEDDLDLHMITPDGSRIYYRNKTAQGGTLDVDMNARESNINIPAVENIFFPDPENGHYKVYLRDFRDRTQNSSSHWMIKVKVGDAEHVFEGDIDASGTEQFVFEFDYGGHGTESTLPPAPDSSTMGGTLVERGARTGKITLSTMWNRFDDVDLHCEAPGDAHIYYGNKTAGGGQLDVDANAGGQRILDPVENIYFENPRNGHYKVYLNQFADRSDDSASYLVRIDIDGEVREFSGTIDTTGTNVPIYEFDYNGAEETPTGTLSGHRYEYYPNADISWTEARAMCQSMGGHLVTITSAEEQTFIESTFPGTTGWIGGYGDNNGWSWVTGETFGGYTHWKSGEPNDQGGIEWCGHLWSDMTWNDLDNEDMSGYQTGFYIEYDEYGDGTGVVSGNNGNTGNTDISNNSGRDFSDAIPISIGQTVDNKSIEEAGQERVVYKFTTGQAGDYTISMRHPQDYFGTAHAIFVLSDSAQNRVSEEEWFEDEVTRTYSLNGNSVYYLEVWDYVIFTVTYGNSGGTDTSADGGYWKLTKVTPYVYNDAEGKYSEGTSSHYNKGEDMYEIDLSESGTNGVLSYNNPYYTNWYGDYVGTGKASATFSLPKTAYAPEETAVITLGASADDTGDGYASINISADFWRGSHTADNLYFTQSSRFTDDDGNYSCEAASPNSDNAPNTTASLTVKGKMPSAPTDISDENQTIINIRIGGAYKGHVVYTYEWTGGSMPSDVGSASGYISGSAPVSGDTGSTTARIPDGAVSGIYNGHTYAVIEQELDPLAANDYCKNIGGYLATITSQGEQDFVASLAARLDYSDFWIGGSDYGSEGNWYWLNGEPWNYTAWYPGGSAGDPEPNNGLGAGEDYVFMNRERGYQWVDGYGGYGTASNYFICEWSSELPGAGGNSGGTTGGIQDERTRQGAGDGKITISLLWDSTDDLDLHIFTPNGSELWWGNPNAQGGVFDIDANREGNMKSNPLENAFFANPVSGEYWIYVYNYEDRTPGKATNWTVRVQVGDEEQIYSGTITSQEETIEVLGFSYTAAANSGSSAGNLLTNGNASDGMNGWQAPDGKWTTDSNYDGVEAYDSHYFCTKGFTGSDGSRMYQDINISSYVGRTATLSAMNRAYRSGHADESMLMIEFLNAGGSVISKASSEKDSGNSEWHRMSVSASVPSGAAKARASLYTFYITGTESDSYYDNVSLIVNG